MLISCAWLNELLEGAPIALEPVTNKQILSAARVAERLTDLGLEVEGLEHFGLPGVIVAEIRELGDHPKADKLHVVQLFDGAGVLQVVCGASNLPEVGGKIAFAPVGITLPGGLEIGARELRGVDSHGMICSEDELEIGSDADGIMVLPKDWVAGTLLRDCIPGIVDSVIDVSVTPNRPDALGHIGVAIDLAVDRGTTVTEGWRALVSKPVEVDLVGGLQGGKSLPGSGTLAASEATVAYKTAYQSASKQLVTIEAPDRCGRYLGFGLEQVRVGPSPEWMRVRLHRLGLRAISNIVDITNYVLMETGQPLHAFDRSKLEEGRVVVRLARAGEVMTTLDGAPIELLAEDLVIADASKPQALAGVMGGVDSSVSSATDRLLLEVAWFDPKGVRRTARRHGFHTDSSHRFERGVDFGCKLELAAARALELLESLSGATCVTRCEVEGELPKPVEIQLRPDHIGALLGMPIDHDEAARILEGLGVRVRRANAGEAWQCAPPSFRPDLEREVDLIEEVMRHHGLDHLPAEHSQASERGQPLREDPLRRRVDELGDALRGTGLHEHLSLAFSSEHALAPFLTEGERERLVRLRNPLRSQSAVMRSHMLPGLLDAVAVNHAHHPRSIALFEIGRVYSWPKTPPKPELGPTAEIDRRLPSERTHAGVILAQRSGDDRSERAVTRACVEQLLVALESLGIGTGSSSGFSAGPTVEPRPAPPVSWLHPGVQIGLWLGGPELGQQIGVVGELHPDIVAARDLGELEIGYGELWVGRMPMSFEPHYLELAKFPSSSRDLSLDLADEVSAAEVVVALRQSFARIGDKAEAEDPIELGSSADPRAAIETVEEYRGKGVEPGRRALLLRLHYRARGRSVTDTEVQALHDAIVDAACAALREIDRDLRVR